MADSATVELSYLLVLSTTVLTQFGVAYWVYRYHWSRRGAKWFVVLCGAGVVWVLPMLLALVLSEFAIQQFAYVVGHLGVVLTVISFVVFTSVYTGTGFHEERVVQVSLAGILGAYLLLAPTNSAHNLIFAEFAREAEPFAYVAVERGELYQVGAIGLQLVVLYSTLRIAQHLLATNWRSGVQLALLVVGAVGVVALESVDQWTTVLPATGFPNATLGMFAFYVCTALALFRFDLLEVKPIARNTVIEDLHNPILVVNDRNMVQDFNGVAKEVWPSLADEIPVHYEECCPELARAIDVPPSAGTGVERIRLTRDGQQRHYAVTISPVSIGGEETGWHSILLRDVTEREQSRRELEQHNERLDKVAASISHDFRNPINLALGHIDFLEQEITDETALEHVEKTRQTNERMLEIIDDILVIARGTDAVEGTESVDLDIVAEEAWSNLDTKSGTLTVASTSRFTADRTKLLTIFENLFRNSFDHGPADCHVEVGATENGFYIQDDGPGIPDELPREDIFEFGYSSAADGTGLGLSIVQMMARSQGWKVIHDRSYEDGTRFVITGVEASDHTVEDDDITVEGDDAASEGGDSAHGAE